MISPLRPSSTSSRVPSVVVLTTGLLVRNVFGQRLLEWWEHVLRRIPFVNAIYNSVKQVSDTLLSESGNAFGKVLLVRYPHAESWSLAFQTSVPAEVTRRLAGDEYVGVFVPTTPSPVNGFYFYVKKSETIELDISVDAAFKAIVSMGVVGSFAGYGLFRFLRRSLGARDTQIVPVSSVPPPTGIDDRLVVNTCPAMSWIWPSAPTRRKPTAR